MCSRTVYDFPHSGFGLPSYMQRYWRLLTLLGLNAVPGIGIFLGGWSAPTALLLYWWENVFGSLLIAVRIISYQKATGDRGPRGFLAGFLSQMLVFSVGHGIFLLPIVFLFLPQELGPGAVVDGADLREGMLEMTAALVAGLIVDLVGIGAWSFAWLKQITDVAMGRMLVVHLTIVFGSATFAFLPHGGAFFGVFVVLKLLLDLAWWSKTPPPTT